MIPAILSNIHFYFPDIQEKQLFAVVYFLIFFLIFRLAKYFALARYLGLLKNKSQKTGAYAVNFVRSIKPWFYLFIALWIAIQVLELPVFIDKVFDAILVIIVALQLANISKVISQHLLKKAAGERAVRDFSGIISVAISIIFVIAGILFALVIFGVNISSLVAGLGFGGVALALATQKVFSDLFNSITVYLDRPFAIGDFITVNGEGGRVEKIGWRSTRLRADSGEEIIIANSLLVAGKINNFKKQEKRRGLTDFSFSLNNPVDKLMIVTKIVASAAKELGIETERASFVKTTGTAAVFEVIYFGPENQKEYFALTEKFLLLVKKKAEENGLLFA